MNKLQTITHVATEFHKKKIIQVKETQLSSGKKSPYYIDLRQILAYPQLMTFIVEYARFKISELCIPCDRIASVPLGAVPFASNIAYSMSVPSVLIRNQEKNHGNKKVFEGILNVDDQVILIEDVITTGGSVIETITKLKNRGAEITAVLCIVDREEGGVENIAHSFPALPVHSLFSISSILNALQVNKLMTEYDIEKIRYFQDCQYKEMLHSIKSRNLGITEQPLYLREPYEYFGTRFPHLAGMLGTTGIVLDFSGYDDWQYIKGEIVRAVNSRTIGAVVIDPRAIGWTEAMGRELLAIKKRMNFYVIVNTDVLVGMSSILPAHNQLDDSDVYMADWVINNVVISAETDIDSVLTDLKNMDAHYVNQRNKLLHFYFRNKQVMQSETMWLKLRDFIISNENVNPIGGLVFNVNEFNGSSIPKKVDLGKWVPVFLHMNTCVDINVKYDEPTSSNDELVRNAVLCLSPHGYIVSEDIISAPIDLIDRIGNYGIFVHNLRLGNSGFRKTITAWVEKLENQPTANLNHLETYLANNGSRTIGGNLFNYLSNTLSFIGQNSNKNKTK